MQLVLLSSQLTQIYIVQCFINIIVLFHIVNLDLTDFIYFFMGGFHIVFTHFFSSTNNKNYELYDILVIVTFIFIYFHFKNYWKSYCNQNTWSSDK